MSLRALEQRHKNIAEIIRLVKKIRRLSVCLDRDDRRAIIDAVAGEDEPDRPEPSEDGEWKSNEERVREALAGYPLGLMSYQIQQKLAGILSPSTIHGVLHRGTKAGTFIRQRRGLYLLPDSDPLRTADETAEVLNGST